MAESKKKSSKPKKPTKKTKRVMDVHKPGKTAPSASSRPVIVGHGPTIQDPMVKGDSNMKPEENQSEEHKVEVKRTSPKVIKPLSSTDEIAKEATTAAETTVANIPSEVTTSVDAPAEPDADASFVDPAPEDSAVEESEYVAAIEDSPETPEVPEEDISQETTQSATEVSDQSKAESKPSNNVNDSGRGSSVVDAVAGAAAKNKDKKTDIQNEEIQKRMAEVEKLIDEKKYFVHTSNTTKKVRKTRWAALVLAILLIAGSYLALDAQLIKNDIKLPYEFFKEEQQAEPEAITENTDNNSEEATSEEGDNAEDSATNENATAQVRARDTERKNEIKDLQLKIETYFADNGSYPEALSELIPVPTTEELTGPRNDRYTYQVGSVDGVINMSYTLSADLENGNDPEAVDGRYVRRSENQ